MKTRAYGTIEPLEGRDAVNLQGGGLARIGVRSGDERMMTPHRRPNPKSQVPLELPTWWFKAFDQWAVSHSRTGKYPSWMPEPGQNSKRYLAQRETRVIEGQEEKPFDPSGPPTGPWASTSNSFVVTSLSPP